MEQTSPIQNKLLRIILIDSYFKGKRIEVDESGFTNLCGANAAGKTTFLKLQRIFYGDVPSDVVKARGKIRKSFVNYYLPRQSSYIIFEYQNQTGVKQVLCFAKKEILSYVFVDKSYDLSDYITGDFLGDKNHSIISCEDIYRKFQLSDIPCALASSSSEYRQVILGTTSVKDKKLSPIRHKYSLAMPGKNLALLNTVVAAALERTTDFNQIKELLSSIMRRGGPNQLDFNVDTQKLNKWQSDYRALAAIGVVNDRTRDLLAQQISLIEINTTRLIQFKRDLLGYKNEFESLVKSNTEELSINKRSWIDSKSSFTFQESQLKTQIEQLDTEISKCKSRISIIEDEKIGWEEKGVTFLESELEKKSHYELQLRTAKDELKSLLEDVLDVQGKYSILREKRLLQFNKAKDNLLSTQHEKQNSLLQLKEKQAEIRSSMVLSHNVSLSEKKSYFEISKNEMLSMVNSINEKLADVPTPKHLSQQLLEQQALFHKESQSFTAASIEKNKVDREIADQEKSLAVIASKQLDIDTQLKNISLELDRLNQLLKPTPGTLHEFINDNIDNWQSSLGKLLTPNVMRMRNLNPSYTEGNNNGTILGLSLDIDSIDTTYEQNEAEILALIKQCEIQRQQLNEEKLSIQTNYKLVTKAKQDLSYKSSTLTTTISTASLRMESAELSINNTQTLIEIEQAKTIAILESDLASANKKLGIHDKCREDTLIDMQNSFQEKYDSLLSTQSGETCDLEVYLDNIAESIITLNKEHKSIINRLNDEEKKELSNNGIDNNKRDDLQLEINSLEDKLDLLKDYPATIKAYQSWVKITYSELEGHQNAFSVNHNELIKVKSALEAKRKENSLANTHFQKIFDKLSNESEVSQKNLSKIDAISSLLNDYTPLECNNEYEHSFDVITADTRPLIQATNKAQLKVKQLVEDFIHIINPHFDSSIKKAVDEQLALNRFDPYYISLGSFLCREFQDVMNETKEVTIEMAAVRGDILMGYYDQLKQFEDEIIKFGNRVNSHLENRTVFTALGKISVELKPLLNSHDLFTSLRQFKTRHIKWVKEHFGELPDQQYSASMSEVLNNFNNSKLIEYHSNLYDVIFHAEVNGETHSARTGNELKEISSNGMSYLILLSFISSIGCMIKANQPVCVTYPVDELGDISTENVSALFDMFKKDNDLLITALPNADNNLVNLYNKRYYVNRSKNRFEYIPAGETALDALLNSQGVQQCI